MSNFNSFTLSTVVNLSNILQKSKTADEKNGDSYCKNKKQC
jgi:hypothetical protein